MSIRVRTRLSAVILVAAVALSAALPCGAATVPQLVSYEGTLTNAAGQPVADGAYGIVFSIYATATGGTALWTETWSAANAVAVTNGGFSVLLGSRTAIPAQFFQANPTTYLGIRVGADAEMLPRQRISSAAYALASGDSVPRGGIIMWSGSVATIPAGWALCDGVQRTALDGTLVTPPDLRDRFVVGASASGGYAVGSAGGSATHTLTLAELPLHSHAVTDPGHTHYVGMLSGTSGSTRFHDAGPDSDNPRTSGSSLTGLSIQNAGGGAAHNNLPPFYALAYIMKL